MQQPPNPYPQPQWQQPPKEPKRTWYRRLFAWCRRHPIATAVIIVVFLGIGAISNALGASNQSTVAPTPTPTQQIALVSTSASNQNQLTPLPTANPTPIPTQKPTPRPQPTQPPVHPTPTKPACQAVNNNPWCFNFSPGKLIYYPPNGFCNYFNCIPTFYGSDDPGDGYIVECNDGAYSQSGGESGACSYHGGVMRPLYSH